MIGDPLCPFYSDSDSDSDAGEAREPDAALTERNRARRAAEAAVAADVAEAEGRLLGYYDERGDITW
jgi:LmbE family N-acetylglucosaminyl deacetylase